jgi:SAM-dependent methyltransferase
MFRILWRFASRAYARLKRLIDAVFFERPAGVETATVVRLSDLGLAGRGVDYEPSPWLVLGRVLPRASVGPGDVFIDFGCGKGRVVLQAAMYPFQRVVGVELSSDLHAAAMRNVARSMSRLTCKNIELVQADVLHYDLPDDVTIAYFFNPFEGEVFAAVVDKLVASLTRKPRPLTIIYMNPVEEATLFRAGAKLVKAVNSLRPTPRWSRQSSVRVYTMTPAANG